MSAPKVVVGDRIEFDFLHMDGTQSHIVGIVDRLGMADWLDPEVPFYDVTVEGTRQSSRAWDIENVVLSPKQTLGFETVTVEQMSWDFSDLIEKPAYTGRAPLHFTVDYFTVAEFAEAKAGSVATCGEWPFVGGRRRMWGPSFSNPAITTGVHGFILLSADLRCDCLLVPPFGVNSRVCYCPGELMCNAICEPCSWHFIGEEPGAVAAWHDHAWPGWRDLPVIPKDVRPSGGGITKSTKAALAWVVEHYPLEWQKPGAPMITERDGIGSRHVGGYSPWGGYDISSTALVAEMARAQ